MKDTDEQINDIMDETNKLVGHLCLNTMKFVTDTVEYRECSDCKSYRDGAEMALHKFSPYIKEVIRQRDEVKHRYTEEMKKIREAVTLLLSYADKND